MAGAWRGRTRASNYSTNPGVMAVSRWREPQAQNEPPHDPAAAVQFGKEHIKGFFRLIRRTLGTTTP